MIRCANRDKLRYLILRYYLSLVMMTKVTAATPKGGIYASVRAGQVEKYDLDKHRCFRDASIVCSIAPTAKPVKGPLHDIPIAHSAEIHCESGV